MRKFIHNLLIAISIATSAGASEVVDSTSAARTVFQTTGGTIPYRIPAIACASNGDLIAVADYRYSKGDIGSGELDLRYRISTDNGKTWGTTQTLISHTYNGGGNLNTGYGDPCIVADRESSRILLMSCSGDVMFFDGTRDNHQGIARFYSEDNGRTWSAPEDISEAIYSLFDNCPTGTPRSMFIASGKISQSKTIKVSGHYRLYCAVLYMDNEGTRKNYVLYSDDFGGRWSVLGGINVAAIPAGADEPKTEELPDGSVLISSRVNGGRFFNIFQYSDITNGEGTWDKHAFSGSDNNGTASPGYTCNGEILIIPAIRKSDGQHVHLLLQSVPFGPGRQNLGIYYKELILPTTAAEIAKDWTGSHQVSRTTSCYSTMIPLSDGTISLLYEENASNQGYDIVYKSLRTEQITGGSYIQYFP